MDRQFSFSSACRIRSMSIEVSCLPCRKSLMLVFFVVRGSLLSTKLWIMRVGFTIYDFRERYVSKVETKWLARMKWFAFMEISPSEYSLMQFFDRSRTHDWQTALLIGILIESRTDSLGKDIELANHNTERLERVPTGSDIFRFLQSCDLAKLIRDLVISVDRANQQTPPTQGVPHDDSMDYFQHETKDRLLQILFKRK